MDQETYTVQITSVYSIKATSAVEALTQAEKEKPGKRTIIIAGGTPVIGPTQT